MASCMMLHPSMSDLDYIEPARVIAWIFDRRERVPTYKGQPDAVVLQHIIQLVQEAKLHVAYNDANELVGVVLYKREPHYLYIHLIITDPPVTLHMLVAAWAQHYPGVSILGWRKKCNKAVLYTPQQVMRALQLMVPDVHPSEICKN